VCPFLCFYQVLRIVRLFGYHTHGLLHFKNISHTLPPCAFTPPPPPHTSLPTFLYSLFCYPACYEALWSRGFPVGPFPNWVSLIIQMYVWAGINAPRSTETDITARWANLFVLQSIDLWLVRLFVSMTFVFEAALQDILSKIRTG
jgi:hypothetical protein